MGQTVLIPGHLCDTCTGEKCIRFLSGLFVVTSCKEYTAPKEWPWGKRAQEDEAK